MDSSTTPIEIEEKAWAKKEPRTIKPLSYDDRKNSSSDLHSRLKTRKVLGVGEIRDDGDIYRSKISQILGHSEHLYIKLPRGLFCWQAANVAYFFGSGLMCLLLPRVAVSLDMPLFICSDQTVLDNLVQSYHLPVRFYGATLIGFCVLYRGLMVTRDRSHVASGLLGSSVLFGLQVLVTIPWAWSCRWNFSAFQIFVLVCKSIFGVIGNYIYYEITSSSSCSPSFSSHLSRLLRRFGLACVFGDTISSTGARTPAASSSYNIANVTGDTPSDAIQANLESATRQCQSANDEKQKHA